MRSAYIFFTLSTNKASVFAFNIYDAYRYISVANTPTAFRTFLRITFRKINTNPIITKLIREAIVICFAEGYFITHSHFTSFPRLTI